MKKRTQIIRHFDKQVFEQSKSAGVDATMLKVGGVTVIRSTRAAKDGRFVVVAVSTASRTRLAKETTKQIRDLISSPITHEQRSKANYLAKSAKDAHSSAVTAKFRRLAA